MKNQNVRTSKFLSYVLRHKPEAIGLRLDKEGWASVHQLITCANKSGKKLNPEILSELVRTNDKKRFELSDDGKKIRAAQGHSINVDLKLEPKKPPKQLYHGTAVRNLASIRQSGLKPGRRQHVHLSSDVETATKVGQRHGKPTLLSIASGRMFSDGYRFYLSANGVWLTQFVPPEYLRKEKDVQ